MRRIGFWVVIAFFFGSMESHGEDLSSPDFSPEITPRTNISRKPSMKDKDHPIPLYFDLVGAGVELKPLEFEYDLESDDGDGIRLGTVQIDAGNFFVDILPLNKLDLNLSRIYQDRPDQEHVFLFRWPDYLMRTGVLEMISRTGRVLWSQEITEQKQEFWKSQLNSWKSALIQTKVPLADIQKSSLFRTQYGIRDLKNQRTPFWNTTENFRFCFTRKENLGQTRLCTFWMEVLRDKKGIRLSPVPLTPQPPRVILMNEQVKLADRRRVIEDRPVQFYAELKSGMSYEFLAVPRKFKLIDMVQENSGLGALLILEGNEPVAPSILLNQQSYSDFMKLIGWQQTIGDLRKFWKTKIKLKDPVVMVSGDGGGVFAQRFLIQNLPREEHRPYLETRTVKETYTDGVKVFGVKQKDLKLRSEQISVETEQENSQEFLWRFGAKNRGEMNRSYLWVDEGEHSFRTYHEIYKGYPREISARLSGVLGSEGKFLFLGELAFNYWFEDILGWTNYYLSRQRWGLSAKGFQSLSPLEISNRSGTLQVTTLDLKYRLDPGLWARDETWGLLAGYQSVKYDEFDVVMLGGGLFWARSMPKIFDDIFNLLPVLRYPKWVDMEFIYYLESMTDSYQLKGMGSSLSGLGNWQLNFHGQVMWTNNFFGEAGFGLKQYDFRKQNSATSRVGKNFTSTSFYGTAGMGYRF